MQQAPAQNAPLQASVPDDSKPAFSDKVRANLSVALSARLTTSLALSILQLIDGDAAEIVLLRPPGLGETTKKP